jgi:hypothetical protein
MLADFLDKEGDKQRRHRAELEDLLNKLKKKEIELKERVLIEKDEHKHKRLNKELEIVKAQRTKGLKTLQEMKGS